MSKVIHVNVINVVRRLCFEGASLPAQFKKMSFFEKITKTTTHLFFHGYGLATLRVERLAKRLTVRWAL